MSFFRRSSNDTPPSRFSRIPSGPIRLLAGCALVAWSIHGYASLSAAKSWSSAPGVIVESHFSRDRRSRTFHARYEYRANGSTYSGRRVCIGDEPSDLDLGVMYPDGAACTVLYNPDDPSDCTLEIGASRTSTWLMLIGIAILGTVAFDFLKPPRT